MAACLPGLAGLVALALLHPKARERQRTLEAQLAQAVRDSTELAELIIATDQLNARRDSVATRVAIIQGLDQGRYIWPHILDEVSAAMPEFTWLTRIAQVAVEPDPDLQIEGRAGNTFALTSFMNRLEASPFLHSVELVTTEQVAERLPGGGEWILNSFVLQVGYRTPRESGDREPLSRSADLPAGAREDLP